MDVMNLLESLFRWIHVVAGIFWIGHLYFFNFVNAHFEATVAADSKRLVVPELRPRALFWFRWGAAFTWVTGILLVLLVYYHAANAFEGGDRDVVGIIVGLVVVLAAPFVYDALVKGPLKDPQVAFWAGIAAAAIVVLVLDIVFAFSYRGYAIHLGGMFGTIMAYNVWFRIWPAQQQIIGSIKAGQAPDAALVGLAGTRSRHNTYMSIPLVYLMMAQHAVWWTSPIALTIVVAAGFAITYHLYDVSKNVKGL